MMPSLQQKVQSVLDELVDTGAETGLQVAVYHHGALVVDAVAGVADGQTGRRATPDTPVLQLLCWQGIDGDLYFGVPRTDLARLARLEDAAPRPVAPPDGGAILAPWELQPTAAMGNSHGILQADIPSVGTFTARGVAAMNAAVLDGRLIDSHQLEEVTAVAFEGTDQVFGNHARLALGYPLGRIGTRPDEAPTTFGWVGGGGSYVYADTATGTSFAMTKTRLTPHFNTAQRLADLTTAEINPHA
jgi:CubicO group peptidase (beta-lactamase class C family)